MKAISILLVLVLVVSSCEKKSADNQLTESQKSEGWKLLFDGKTTEGWRTYRNKENDSWEIIDGALHSKVRKGDMAAKRADLITIAEYGDFELTVEWKLEPKGNSGIIYHATEEFEEPYQSGPEYQILDEVGFGGEIKPGQYTAADYDMYPPAENKSKPVGEWNTSKIVVHGNHVEHWLNGVKVVEYESGSDDWKEKYAVSKWKNIPGYGTSSKGHITLQDHDGGVWFRNIAIKEL